MELLTLLPFWYQILMISVIGVVIGSFLNVVIYRLNTGKSLAGHSHCMSCSHRLRWYELLPLISYVFLKGRCSQCGCSIPVRYFIVELSTAILFLIVFLQFGIGLLFLFSVILVSVLMVVMVYDIYHMIIPDKLVVIISVLAVTHFFLIYGTTVNTQDILGHTLSALGVFMFYGGLWFISKGRWIGLGDAKLAAPLGFILGSSGAFSMVVVSFWIGAVVSILIMTIPAIFEMIHRCCSKNAVAKSSKSITMKSEVPFAPFLIVAFFLVYLYQLDVLALGLI